MLNLRTLILGQPRTCPQTGLQNEPRYSEKPSEFGTVNWTPYLNVQNSMIQRRGIHALKNVLIAMDVLKILITITNTHFHVQMQLAIKRMTKMATKMVNPMVARTLVVQGVLIILQVELLIVHLIMAYCQNWL